MFESQGVKSSQTSKRSKKVTVHKAQADPVLINIGSDKQTSQSVNVAEEAAGPLTIELENYPQNIQV